MRSGQHAGLLVSGRLLLNNCEACSVTGGEADRPTVSTSVLLSVVESRDPDALLRIALQGELDSVVTYRPFGPLDAAGQ